MKCRCTIPCSIASPCSCSSGSQPGTSTVIHDFGPDPVGLSAGFEESYRVEWPEAGDKRWLQAHGELRDLHIEKSSTYGTGLDRLANFTESAEVLGKPDEYPVLVRMLDKISRAVHMVEAGLANGVKEYPDLASLALCAEALRRRRTS